MASDHGRGSLQRVRTLNVIKLRSRTKPLEIERGMLAAIYDDYHQPIYRYIYRLVGDAEVTRDLVADVFCRLLQSTQRESNLPRNPKAWLYRTAHNIVVDYFRRQQYRGHLPLDEEQVSSTERDPMQTAEHRLSTAEVRSALRHLTPDQQQVIILKYLEGLSNKEVAAVLNKPVGAVKSLQHRALSALRRHLIPDEEQIIA